MEHKIENNWNIFYESQTSCSVGKGRYVIEEAKSRPFPLSTEFVTDVCQLPSHDFSSEKYKAFLDKWGTHVVVEVELGYKERQVLYTTKEELLQSILADKSLDNIRNELLEVKQRNSPGERSSVVIDIDRLMESPFKKNHFTNNFENVVISQNDLKEAISIKVMSIATVLDGTFWQLGNAYLQNGYCTPSHLEDVGVNIAKAMTSYALESDARISKSRYTAYCAQ
ncbi:hypothetical protein BSL78_26122 [Apostichopus japonicus]|uniref:MACPF domain-containing protein n=1 Tax=Stichopus japonicus TaxID=307972 RepID=A0A2G8JMX0_STIJA|nr:hypothetical protein BSL78_26122 [Apostichopus japonicus]